jgi:uncharacterized protein YcbX
MVPAVQPRLKAIYVYPIKSCAPQAPHTAEVERRGLKHDRRWMLIDEHGKFISGREVGALVKVTASAGQHGLHISAPGMETLTVRIPRSENRRRATLWGETLSVVDAGDGAAGWFSQFAGRSLRLVHADSVMQRPVEPEYSHQGDAVAFPDGFPLLLLSQAAVDELSTRVGREMEAGRFRPNLLISGVAAHAEDGWKRVRVGSVLFDVVKPCVRCVFTTVDPLNGERSADGEPLRTLKSYRHNGKGITFGQNLIPRSKGSVHVGDALEVIE